MPRPLHGSHALLRVLAATDGSERGGHAVEVGRALAGRVGGEVAVVSVEAHGMSGPPLPSVGHRAAPVGSLERILRGYPGVEIAREAELSAATLVVLGRRPRSPDLPRDLGPTADAVLRRSGSPCLFVPRSIGTITRALIALDGTDRGLGLLLPALELTTVVGASRSAVLVLPAAGLEGDDQLSDPRRIRVEEALHAADPAGSCPVFVARGDPVRTILDRQAAIGADLLVLGVRRGGPVGGDPGSGHVGRDLLRLSPGAVLTIPI